MSQHQQKKAQEQELKMLDYIANNKNISLRYLELKIRNIYTIQNTQSEEKIHFEKPLATLRHWQDEGILHVKSYDRLNYPRSVAIVWENWNFRSDMFLELTERGWRFHETRKIPPSKYSKRRPRNPVNNNGIDVSITTHVDQERVKISKPKSLESAKKRIAQAIASRQGQEKFREDLFKIYGNICLVTGPNVPDILEAAHIEPYSKGGTFDVSNGLLLRADVHTLFDLGLIAVDTSNMSVILSPKLNYSPYKLFSGEKLHFPPGTEDKPSRDALDIHRELTGL
ncbi:HNH endonuclease [Candidatus Viridilinea mediisalina]|nr:HNH endonuclease [Candidatus Viridilinea mediisalina]